MEGSMEGSMEGCNLEAQRRHPVSWRRAGKPGGPPRAAVVYREGHDGSRLCLGGQAASFAIGMPETFFLQKPHSGPDGETLPPLPALRTTRPQVSHVQRHAHAHICVYARTCPRTCRCGCPRTWPHSWPCACPCMPMLNVFAHVDTHVYTHSYAAQLDGKSILGCPSLPLTATHTRIARVRAPTPRSQARGTHHCSLCLLRLASKEVGPILEGRRGEQTTAFF